MVFSAVFVGNNTIFTQNYRNSFIYIVSLHLGKQIVNILLFRICSPLVSIAPCGIFGCYCKDGRIVIMNRNSNHLVIRQFVFRIAGLCQVIVCTGQKQKSVSISASCTSDNIYKCLVECVQCTIIERHFVHAFQYKMIVIILEIICNFCPHCLVAGERIHAGIKPVFGIVSAGAVPVHVDNNIHAVIISIVNNFLDTGKISIINIISFGVGVFKPGHWNSDRVKTFGMNGINHSLCGDGVAPHGFGGIGIPASLVNPASAHIAVFICNPAESEISFRTAGAVECVAQIPAHAHFIDNINCRFICGTGSGRKYRTNSSHRTSHDSGSDSRNHFLKFLHDNQSSFHSFS